MNDSEQTEGEHLTALGSSEPFPFRLLITFAATNAGWNMVVLLRCRLQYSLFRPILPSLHRPLGALGSNPLSGQANSLRQFANAHCPLPRQGGFLLEFVPRTQKAPPLAGELSVNDSEQTEGEYLTALGFFEPFPFRHFVPLSPHAGTAFG